MSEHAAEINRIQALKEANARSIQEAAEKQRSRYTRSFTPHPSPPLSSSPDESRRNSLDTGDTVITGIKRNRVALDLEKRFSSACGGFKRMALDTMLTDMLEELREGSEEVAMN